MSSVCTGQAGDGTFSLGPRPPAAMFLGDCGAAFYPRWGPMLSCEPAETGLAMRVAEVRGGGAFRYARRPIGPSGVGSWLA